MLQYGSAVGVTPVQVVDVQDERTLFADPGNQIAQCRMSASSQFMKIGCHDLVTRHRRDPTDLREHRKYASQS
jgi:hypothetical protein